MKRYFFFLLPTYRIVCQTYEYESLAEYSIWGKFFRIDDWKLWESVFYSRKTSPFKSINFKNKKIIKCIFKQKK